jgi:ABC-type transport system involved in multi-copper enzyme maturation permease subunit
MNLRRRAKRNLEEFCMPLRRNCAPLRAILLRELHSALVNRYLQIFSVLALGCGIGAVFLSEAEHAPIFFVLQVALYCVPLFALLAGVSSARAEAEEWPILFAQPVPRTGWLLAKFAAQWALFAVVLLLLFGPALCFGAPAAPLARLFVQTAVLGGVFTALGSAAGIFAHERVQALILGISAWLGALVGLDLLALGAAQWSTLQKLPDLWVGLLMVNPLDAFRIQALFAMEQIPAEAANKTPLAAWWLEHAGLWFLLVAAAWAALLLIVTSRRLACAEV